MNSFEAVVQISKLYSRTIPKRYFYRVFFRLSCCQIKIVQIDIAYRETAKFTNTSKKSKTSLKYKNKSLLYVNIFVDFFWIKNVELPVS